MRFAGFFGQVPACIIGLCTAVNFAIGQGFNFDSTNTARPLSPQERTTLQTAIGNITQTPPDSLTFKDDRGVSHTVSCAAVGRDLAKQLADGHVGAETNPKGAGRMWVLPDSSRSPSGDQMNVDPVTVGYAGVSAAWMRCLEACLVHEWYHKCQDTVELRNNDLREEVAPFYIQAAYYCSTAATPGDTNDPFTKNAKEWAKHCQPQVAGPALVRPMNPRREGNHYVFLKCDTVPMGARDSIITISPDDEIFHGYPLLPMRGSDLVFVDDPPFLPPGHKLAVVYGGFPLSGVASILLLDFFGGEIISPVWSQDFGPPSLSSMFFYSVTKQDPDGPWYVLDTLSHRILIMQDMVFDDDVPDEISGIFAEASWPGMAALMYARGIETITHPLLGEGVLVLDEDNHFHETLYPHDGNYFLQDTDGNQQADIMQPMPIYEFLDFTPIIQEPQPWPGDLSVNLFASWDNDVAVWSTDSTGELLYEELGMVHVFPEIHAVCPLSRPLIAGEYIMPLDLQTDLRPLPTLVSLSTPQRLVLYVNLEAGIIRLMWDAVPGASEYAIWISNDAVNYYDSGLRTMENHFEMALSPANKQFFHVTAIR